MKRALLIIGFGLFLVGCNSNISNPSPVQAKQTMNINLAWQSVHGAQLGFFIEASIDGQNFTQILTVPDGVNAASIPVESGATYYFRMRSFNSAGTSNYTPVVTVKL